MTDVVDTTSTSTTQAVVAATTTPTPATPAAAALTDPPAAAGLKLPGADAKPEDWQAFYRQLGAPEKGDGYGLTVPEGGDKEFAKEAADTFAKAGLRPDQAKLLTEWWNTKAGGLTAAQQADAVKAETDRVTALDTKNRAEDAQLRNDWGQAHDANINVAKQAAKQFFGDKLGDVVTAIESAVGYGQTMRIMHAIGKGLGEGKELGLNSTPTPAQGGSLENSFKDALAKAGVSK